jgi:hypothetical protein
MLAVESVVTATATKPLALIAGRRWQFGTALAAHLPHFSFFEISH